MTHPKLTAAGLIALPIVCAVLFFVWRAPVSAPGVYVEVLNGSRKTSYVLTGYVVNGTSSADDVAKQTLVGSFAAVTDFFVVESASTPAPSAELRLFVVANGDPAFHAPPLVVPVEKTPVNARVYRLRSAVLNTENPQARDYYRSVRRLAVAPRATLELVAGLVLTDASGQQRMYSVRLGGK